MTYKIPKQNYTIAAIYRMWRKGLIQRQDAEALLQSRAGLPKRKAIPLVSIWARHFEAYRPWHTA